MAWFDELNLPGATIDGFFGYVTADGPAEDAPSASMAFATQIGGITTTGDARVARVEVSPGGSVTAYVSTRTAWIGLDGIEWEAKS